MRKSDAERWNERYRGERYRTFEGPRPFLVNNAAYLPASGLALDFAMGLGGNSGFLLERGLDVIGVDIAAEAVKYAKRRSPELMAVIADLNHFYLPSAHFDVILNFFFLQRATWPGLKRALKPGGLLYFETMTIEMRSTRPDIDPAYLLEPGELRESFSDLEILVYHEGWTKGRRGHPRATASMIARKSL